LLTRVDTGLQIRSQTLGAAEVEPYGGIGVAVRGLRDQLAQNHAARVFVLHRVIADHRTQVWMIEPGNFGMVHLADRFSTVGNRERIELWDS
jgi:hypothetical protein